MFERGGGEGKTLLSSGKKVQTGEHFSKVGHSIVYGENQKTCSTHHPPLQDSSSFLLIYGLLRVYIFPFESQHQFVVDIF